MSQRYKREKRFATIYNDFEKSKQSDRDSKERIKEQKRLKQFEQQLVTQQMRLENIHNLASARQTFSAAKNYQGNLHKRERDRVWATKRHNDTMHVQKNS